MGDLVLEYRGEINASLHCKHADPRNREEHIDRPALHGRNRLGPAVEEGDLRVDAVLGIDPALLRHPDVSLCCDFQGCDAQRRARLVLR